MVILKISRTGSDVADFLVSITLGALAPLAFIVRGFLKRDGGLAPLAWVFYLRHHVWTQIDYLFNLTFFKKEDDRLLVRFMG